MSDSRETWYKLPCLILGRHVICPIWHSRRQISCLYLILGRRDSCHTCLILGAGKAFLCRQLTALSLSVDLLKTSWVQMRSICTVVCEPHDIETVPGVLHYYHSPALNMSSISTLWPKQVQPTDQLMWTTIACCMLARVCTCVSSCVSWKENLIFPCSAAVATPQVWQILAGAAGGRLVPHVWQAHGLISANILPFQ